MANLGKMFDPNQHEPATIGGSQLPVSDKTGWPMIVTESEMKQTAAQDGQGYLEVTVRIIEGERTGLEGKARFNLFNKNEQTVNIAERELTALAYSVGIFQPFNDSALLHNRPFRGVVGLQKVKPGEESKGYTELKGYLDINGNQPGKTGAVAPASAPQPVAAPVAPPTPATPAPAANVQPTWGAPPTAAPAASAQQPPWAQKP